jgi:hypothetical protein
MGKGFAVSAAELRGHAKDVDGFGQRVDLAADAADHLRHLDDAYGLYCQRFGAMLVEPQVKAAQNLALAAAGLHGMADKLRTTADTYVEIDEKLAAVCDRLTERLDNAASRGSVVGNPGSSVLGNGDTFGRGDIPVPGNVTGHEDNRDTPHRANDGQAPETEDPPTDRGRPVTERGA